MVIKLDPLMVKKRISGTDRPHGGVHKVHRVHGDNFTALCRFSVRSNSRRGFWKVPGPDERTEPCSECEHKFHIIELAGA